MWTAGFSREQIQYAFKCVFSVMGTMGLVLVFAEVPQLAYAERITVFNIAVFGVGFILVFITVAGHILISYLIRARNLSEGTEAQTPTFVLEIETTSRYIDDKPPTYDDLIRSEGTPPHYMATFLERPPSYEETARTDQRTSSVEVSCCQGPSVAGEKCVT